MHNAWSEPCPWPRAGLRSLTGAVLQLCLAAFCLSPGAHADVIEPVCEYRTIEVDGPTGDIRFISPQKTGPEDCTDTGAALGELNPDWRRQLPPRVRWRQRDDATSLCQSMRGDLGERTALVPAQGCVFLLRREVCTIVTAQAVSHAQLSNAIRHCVP